MADISAPSLSWVVLTLGNREKDLDRALASIGADPVEIILVVNADTDVNTDDRVRVHHAGKNLGVPGGRDLGVSLTTAASVVGFLDDDAVFRGELDRVLEHFAADDRLGATAFRLVDEHGETSRRHVPRLGGRGPERSGPVALFLGGACAIRREAYDEVGGYFNDLIYGHEEVELSWRLIDAGWNISYLADVEVFHPRTTIERHADGWEMTGRNRVLIARRTLPWMVALVHVGAWLVVGAMRAPSGESRRSYLRGWRHGWRQPVQRQPIGWRGVVRLTMLGRPPIV